MVTPFQEKLETLEYEATRVTPYIHFDPSTGIMRIQGASMPENVTEFYGPIIDWLSAYGNAPCEKTIPRFQLAYFNTATSKIFMELIARIETIAEQGHETCIEWWLEPDDDDMREAGEDYANLTTIPVVFKDIK